MVILLESAALQTYIHNVVGIISSIGTKSPVLLSVYRSDRRTEQNISAPDSFIFGLEWVYLFKFNE